MSSLIRVGGRRSLVDSLVVEFRSSKALVDEYCCCTSKIENQIISTRVFLLYGCTHAQELVGLLKALNDVKCMSSAARNAALIDVMRHLVRTEAEDDYPEVLAAARPLFDHALVTQFSKLTHQGLAWTRWLEIHKGMALLVLKKDDMEAVLKSKGDYIKLAPQLSRLHAGSMLGRAVFGFARTVCANKALQIEIDKSLEDVKKNEFSAESIGIMKKKCEELIKVFDDAKVVQKREVEIEIKGVKFKVVPQNGRQEYEWRLMALLKTNSMGTQGGLPWLPHERLMVPKEHLKETGKCKVQCLAALRDC